MLEDYFGVVELVFSFSLIVGFCLWQIWATEKAKKKFEQERAKREGD